MKSILDVSLLGQGYFHEKSRTGVFRVAENLALKLPTISKNLEVLFADSLDLTSSICYLNTYFENQQPTFINESKEIFLAKFQSKILTGFPLNSITQKILKKIFYQLNSQNIHFNEAKMLSAELYHSSYFPFPKQIQEQHKIKKVITIYDLIPIKYPTFFQNRSDNVVHQIINSLQEDTYAICISESTKNDLQEITKLPDSQVFVVPLAASKEIFYQEKNQVTLEKIRLKYKIPTDFSYFLSIATLEPRKNIDTLIKSFIQLVSEQKIADLCLLLVGTKGWDFDKIFEASNVSNEIKERIIFTGYVPDEDLAPLYSGALSFVYMSHYEGFGLPVLEAMQCGTSVICSNNSSLPEVVGNNGESAILVAPTDKDGISDAMLNFYKNPSFSEQFGKNGLIRSNFFSWEKFAEDNWKVYQSIV